MQLRTLVIDLYQFDAIDRIIQQTNDLEIGLVIPNAGTENTGELIDNDLLAETRLIHLNMTLPMQIPLFSQQTQQVAKLGLSILGSKASVASGTFNNFLAWEN